MQPPNKTPREAGKLAQGKFDFRHSEDLIIKDTAAPQVACLSLTTAGAYVSRRFCIRPVIADLVASLAGLGPDRRAA